ncbi:MAG: SusF/SusE family outer membrane protein [Bacteroidaceae bacterium]|nr:SusF/SusE family outer membrane protein [Bacteroidaceae bacterium]
MKRIVLFFILHFSLFTFHLAFGQSRLWVRGSAVPGGIQELTRFSTNTSGRYTFKFHGKLLPGDLYITTTDTPKSSSRYYAPKLVDTNIVSNKADYVLKSDSIGNGWAVLFEADNYRFTVDVTNKQLTGELFTRWYEAWICGGCVEDEQGKGISGQEGHWQISSGKQMEQSWEDPNVFEWTGYLASYSYNAEPKRFKINGQYGWSPKVLHSYTQDASILTAKQVWYNGSEDYKWAISRNGYYRIKINVFEETIEGEYLGGQLPDGIQATPEAEADISVKGREIAFHAETPMSVRLYSLDGTQRNASFGTDLTLTAPTAGIYVLTATDGRKGVTWKIMVR